MRSRWSALAALSIVLLAGCSGFGFGPGSPTTDTATLANTTSTTTPNTATTTTTTATTTAEESAQFPPGITADGVEEPFTVSGAHETILQESSYSVQEVSEISYAENGTVYTRNTVSTQVSSTENRFLFNSTMEGSFPRFGNETNGTVAHYSNGSVAFRKIETGQNSTYGIIAGPSGQTVPPSEVSRGTPLNNEWIPVLLAGFSNDSVTKQDESTYRVTATSFKGDSLEVDGLMVTNVTAANLTATVTADGLVKTYQLSFQGTVNGDEVNVTEQVTYSDIGSTTVEQPSWYDRAVANSSN